MFIIIKFVVAFNIITFIHIVMIEPLNCINKLITSKLEIRGLRNEIQ